MRRALRRLWEFGTARPRIAIGSLALVVMIPPAIFLANMLTLGQGSAETQSQAAEDQESALPGDGFERVPLPDFPDSILKRLGGGDPTPNAESEEEERNPEGAEAPTSTPTSVPNPSPEPEPTAEPASTPVPEATATPVPSPTPSPVPTREPSPTPVPSPTPTAVLRDEYQVQFWVQDAEGKALGDAIIVFEGERFWVNREGYLHIYLAPGTYSAWAQKAGYEKDEKSFAVESEDIEVVFQLPPLEE